jgi:regulator of extracellular matrix RemA (YlzA/DUF370 family)
VVRSELKDTKRLKMNMLCARETLIEATYGIRTKAHVHYDNVDRLALAITSLYRVPQDKALKDAKVAAMALELVRVRHELHQSARASEALKDELLERTTELMAVQEDKHVLNTVPAACSSNQFNSKKKNLEFISLLQLV